MIRHLNWWKSKMEDLTLNHIAPNLIAKYRKELLSGQTPQGKQQTLQQSTVIWPRSQALLTYGVKE